MPNWVLKEFAEILAEPVCTVLNSTFREQKFLSAWKLANITPLIKTKPVTNASMHLRPISLTSALSKVEDFVVDTSALLYYRLLTQTSLEPFLSLLPRMPSPQ